MTDVELTPKQREAVSLIFNHQIAIIHGAPGTGKTTVIKKVIDNASAAGLNFVLAAPTGKAAKRISETTGHNAVTIHKLLCAVMYKGKWSFAYNKDTPLQSNMIIIDESSMITNSLAASLLRAVPDTSRILFVGDNYQLPSVGTGAVFRDMIESKKIPAVELTEIHRNCGDIVKACHDIKNGIVYKPSPKIDKTAGLNLRHIESPTPEAIISSMDIIYERMEKEGYDLTWDVQVLSAVNEKTDLSCASLNQYLRKKLNENLDVACDDKFSAGDKIINIRNIKVSNSDGSQDYLINGDMGTVIDTGLKNKATMLCKFTAPDRTVIISKTKNHLLHGYAITVHRFQGSECPVIIIPVHSSISYLMDRPWLYTAISRAQNLCFTVGQWDIVERGIGKVHNYFRKTFLKEKLKGEF